MQFAPEKFASLDDAIAGHKSKPKPPPNGCNSLQVDQKDPIKQISKQGEETTPKQCTRKKSEAIQVLVIDETKPRRKSRGMDNSQPSSNTSSHSSLESCVILSPEPSIYVSEELEKSQSVTYENEIERLSPVIRSSSESNVRQKSLNDEKWQSRALLLHQMKTNKKKKKKEEPLDSDNEYNEEKAMRQREARQKIAQQLREERLQHEALTGKYASRLQDSLDAVLRRWSDEEREEMDMLRVALDKMKVGKDKEY